MRSGKLRARSLLLICSCLLFLIVPRAQVENQEDVSYTKSFELDNGLRVFLYEKHTLPLVNCVFGVNVGSKDETAENNGLVHILEHYILFRGTKQRSGEEVGQDMRRHGAYFNAHTGRDLSLFDITLPSEHLGFALNNLKDILFNLDINQAALDEEKEVILEEINQLHDDPFRLATSMVYQNLFPDHPYQKPIYGTPETIQNATAEQMAGFYEKYFHPGNSSLAVVGDFSLAQAEEAVRKIFKNQPRGEFIPAPYPKTSSLKKTIEIEHTMDVNLGYLVIGLTGPDYNDPDQYAVDVLTEIFGRGINPMLYHPLIQRRIQVNSVIMGYSAYQCGGAIIIQIALEPKNLKRAYREIRKYLKNSHRLEYSAKDVFGEAQMYAMDFMDSAKNRIRFRGEQAQERGLAIASSLARYMLLNETEDRGDYLEHIEEISSRKLRGAAGDYLGQKNCVVIFISPQEDE
jgi:predicted Zn-dependent peptidase